MGERTSGLHSVLASARVYSAFQWALGRRSARSEFVDRYLQVGDGERVLDMGCGTATLLERLPSVEYVGFDPSIAYIEEARNRHGDRGTFFVAGIDDIDVARLGTFDLVIAKGVLHHVNDRQARRLLKAARAVLRPEGRLVTFDGAFSARQSRMARVLVSLDRGGHVRTVDAYQELAQNYFDVIEVHERHDLLRLPYTHVLLVCRGSRTEPSQIAES